jgi:hypothetical protein
MPPGIKFSELINRKLILMGKLLIAKVIDFFLTVHKRPSCINVLQK